ncbi:MAG: glutaminyl-tRNA synthase (glutamine-hydrolyzing) subunit A [Candidatus Spechtbacteria bacterium RIFCSPLOWO2_12_FULL_38_22]|uniref:Glutamyl-tRNA(Gln) amidotransferase subunit A n=1 Tax=Candidatus Spechtbacteria bacterium RIFCSPLOWO2_12_FULL_38_22 TaxID=1802165 RepID=A0A1G2HG87_9BACT|nr:MAG: glutaminyl-tRNA synthase (glutamine-hydrolyzing) subunit A [Candidatus Spechtbacteria bacterium RIFCSPHIGHO2_01_FULL_38_11]OGZ59253.1 MAG: glutaminyl-tRNA synthase (glutamine-hydrolyzing) subunit A [Candidatus Spechtbacteria bacterium RIFCSPLOWO2_01_FULL_38_20]OGZ60261.1 MAG: glutaminyl-tRNA synthase (glutamine-hydrolyzing) subunit A [Candidatus Spechtbacteria bacterium RIFCSPHIGHO2_12_FULL_38_30]OGZ61504.1 MAG: glutaminyl-tRNA synthase (glutamine-hydrolyzing) subunit A [Candidatus Spech
MTLKQVLQKIQSKEISCLELADFYLGNIKKKDKQLHSFLYVNEEGIKKEAKIADKNHSDINFKTQPLYGVPYALKDNILVENMPTTAGSMILENYNGGYDSAVVSKLRNVGALVLGKTNMDEFAMGSSTENSAFGPSSNPHDVSRVPGGSSGGSAVAVAADLAPFALGSDTGGSIRQPAAFCGVVGFKPSYGAVSRYGLIAMASSLDQIGVFTQTVDDATLVFSCLIGKDVMDSTSREIDKPKNKFNIENLRIGIIKENFGEGLDNRIRDKIYEAVDVYKKMGASVEELSLPYADFGLAAYYIIMPAEVSSNLAKFDGIRYGTHLVQDTEKSLIEDYAELRGKGFGKEVLRRIMLGTYTLSAGYYDAYYLKAQKVRTLIKKDYENAFAKVDVIISPTTPTLPFKFGEKTKNPLEMYLSDIYTVNANLAGVPAISIPIGIIKEEGKNLPVGMQITGPQKRDFFVLDVARAYEKAVGN